MRRKRVVRQRSKGPIDARFGRRVRDLRVGAGLTQAQLAGADFSKGFISLVETGRTRASLRAAQIFARRLGVPLADLLEDGERGDVAARLRGLVARARRVESALADAERLRAELAGVRAELERELADGLGGRGAERDGG